jgi:trehalose 6-phosphate synthase/phosphatase
VSQEERAEQEGQGSRGSQESREGREHDLVVVANRLPVDRKVNPDGSTTWQSSPGGLVAALEPVMQRNAGAWIGWTGAPGDAPDPFDARGIRLIPVNLDEGDVEDFYEGMSNGTFWPLYHDVIVSPQFHRHWWEAYVRVNRRFAQMAAAHAADNALVWVQDYQLQLVPQMLRERRPDLRIGFFNHIPFPPYEIFAQLPWRRQVLDGLLGADQLGFQRPADANNFLRACRRNGLATRRGMVQLPAEPRFGSPDNHPSRQVRAAAFPISIDFQKTDELARTERVQERAREIRRELGDPEVVLLGVDRLDYTKGIGHRLKAVEELFADGVLSSPGAVLVQVATPSRERIGQYQEIRQDVEVTVGRINGDHGTIGRPVVHYLHQSYDREELSALYLASDVLLVTALRDGMNLVAKEYVASRFDERGALVLSEFAGAANELPQSFLINPHDIDGLKAAIVRAAQISPREAQRRMRAMRRRVAENDVAAWASMFLKVTSSASLRPEDEEEPARPSAAARSGRRERNPVALPAGAEGPAEPAGSGTPGTTPGDLGTVPGDSPDRPQRPVTSEASRAFHSAHSSRLPSRLVNALEGFAMRPSLLLAFDFDGVISPIVPEPSAARPLPESRRHLSALVDLPGVRLAMISGRTLEDLRAVASPPPGALLVGSHGAEFSDPAIAAGAQVTLDAAADRLLARLTTELRRISADWPGTAVEVKPTGAVLHTRQAERHIAAKATQEALDGPAAWPGVYLTKGKEVVELSVVSVNKGTALRQLREFTGADAVLFAGDDVTDERGFAVLDGNSGDVSIRVGSGETAADHRLGSPEEVTAMLGLLVDLCRE